MSQTKLNNTYKTFVHDTIALKNQGNISEDTFRGMIVGASIFMINQKFTNDFNSYIHNKFEPHCHNSMRQAKHF